MECEHGGCSFIALSLSAFSGRLGVPSANDFSQETNTLAKVSYITRSMTEEWEYSANNLLAHFRCVLRGMVPFSSSVDWCGPREKLDENALLGMDDMAIKHMETVTKMLPSWLEQKRMSPPSLSLTDIVSWKYLTLPN
jgi:hypothetical protein